MSYVFQQPHDIDHVIPKKVKKEMQQQAKNQKTNSEVAETSIISLPKELIHHRPAPKKILSLNQRIDNLESCVKKIKTSSRDAKNSKESQKCNSKQHNNEITVKEEVFEKNAKQKKKRGRRGRKKIIN